MSQVLKPIPLLVVTLILGSCSTVADRANRVSVMGRLTGNIADDYVELGPVQCSELTRSDKMEELCQAELRNQVADLGGDTLVVEERERVECRTGIVNGCLKLKGKAYRERAGH